MNRPPAKRQPWVRNSREIAPSRHVFDFRMELTIFGCTCNSGDLVICHRIWKFTILIFWNNDSQLKSFYFRDLRCLSTSAHRNEMSSGIFFSIKYSTDKLDKFFLKMLTYKRCLYFFNLSLIALNIDFNLISLWYPIDIKNRSQDMCSQDKDVTDCLGYIKMMFNKSCFYGIIWFIEMVYIYYDL